MATSQVTLNAERRVLGHYVEMPVTVHQDDPLGYRKSAEEQVRIKDRYAHSTQAETCVSGRGPMFFADRY